MFGLHSWYTLDWLKTASIRQQPIFSNLPPLIHQEFQNFRSAFLPFVFNKTEVAKPFEIALLIHGHLLIEDFPGIGKTTIAKAFAKLVGYSFSRIQ